MQNKRKHIANFMSLGICAIIFMVASLLNASDNSDLLTDNLILAFSAVFIVLVHLFEFFHIRSCGTGKKGSIAPIIVKFVFVFFSFNATITFLATDLKVSSCLLFADAVFACVGIILL